MRSLASYVNDEVILRRGNDVAALSLLTCRCSGVISRHARLCGDRWSVVALFIASAEQQAPQDQELLLDEVSAVTGTMQPADASGTGARGELNSGEAGPEMFTSR